MSSAAVPAPVVKPTKGVEEDAKLHRIRITLTSRNVPNLEKGKSPNSRVLAGIPNVW